MTGKTGKKELLTILLAGLCLNLSTLHLHSLNEHLIPDGRDTLQYISEDLPFCFACKHISYGYTPDVTGWGEAQICGAAPQLLKERAPFDITTALHFNKSPPLGLLVRSSFILST